MSGNWPRRIYLGDGVYAVHDGFALTLTTENGIRVTNEIVLEPEVVVALLAWIQVIREVDKT